jgi:hypothetical protein
MNIGKRRSATSREHERNKSRDREGVEGDNQERVRKNEINGNEKMNNRQAEANLSGIERRGDRTAQRSGLRARERNGKVV